MDAFWIILCAVLASINCSLLGCFLVLRKTAMIADAISHAILPGIVFSFLILGDLQEVWSFLGASLFGILATYLIEFFSQKIHIQKDAAIGVVFTFLFAIGVLFINLYAEDIDIDQECVLFGEIAYTPFNTWTNSAGIDMGPKVIWILGGIAIFIVFFIFAFFKELQITTFDPAFAKIIGLSTTLWYYVLMSIVSLTTVASFESIGSILVVAFLIVPPATAYLVTGDLKKMLYLSVIVGVLSSITGYYFSVLLNSSIAAAIVTMSGIFFLLTFIYQRIVLKKHTFLQKCLQKLYHG